MDSSGNLYVVDSGNNRILRFPRGARNPDMVIGQPSPNFNLPNQGQGRLRTTAPSAWAEIQRLSFSTRPAIFISPTSSTIAY